MFGATTANTPPSETRDCVMCEESRLRNFSGQSNTAHADESVGAAVIGSADAQDYCSAPSAPLVALGCTNFASHASVHLRHISSISCVQYLLQAWLCCARSQQHQWGTQLSDAMCWPPSALNHRCREHRHTQGNDTGLLRWTDANS